MNIHFDTATFKFVADDGSIIDNIEVERIDYSSHNGITAHIRLHSMNVPTLPAQIGTQPRPRRLGRNVHMPGAPRPFKAWTADETPASWLTILSGDRTGEGLLFLIIDTSHGTRCFSAR